MKNKYDNMLNVLWWCILFLGILILINACARKVYVPVEHKTIETVTLHDTVVKIQLDVIRDSVVMPDTISYLQNKYAESWVKCSEGNLHHSLSSKNTTLPINIQYKEIEKITEVPTPYPVEVVKYVEQKLSWWQKSTMWLGQIILASGALILAIWILKKK